MNPIYENYILIPVLLSILLIALWINSDRKYFKFIKKYWYLKSKTKRKVSVLFFVLAMSVWLFALLDFRGDEKKITGSMIEKKTIILIDTSMSMLVEDVRPNRFQKAILLARHFIKNSPGHTISVILFSDIHKKLVPFTKDLELLDSRVSGLKDLKIRSGGTNLSTVLQESLVYLGTDVEKRSGNILLITDAEENEAKISLEIPDNISVAVVGIGTKNGGKIPLRDSRGVLLGYKTYEGNEVVSKLEESNIKQLGKDIKNFKFWTASTYSLPTKGILNFFNSVHNQKNSSGDIIIKPVTNHFVIIFGIILYLLSVLFKLGKNYKSISLLMLLTCVPKIKASPNIVPQQLSKEEQKELAENKAKINHYLNEWKKRKLDDEELKDLGSLFLKVNEDKASFHTLKQALNEKEIDENNKADFFNFGTSALKQKDFKNALGTYRDLLNYLKQDEKKNEELIKKTQENITLALQQKEQQKQNKSNKNNKNKKKDQKNKQDKQNQQNQKDQNKQDQKNDQKNQDQQNKDQQSQKNKDQQKDSEQKDKNKDKKEQGKEKDKKDNDKKDGDQKDQQKDKQKQKNQNKKQGQQKKLPAILKQLVNDDRKLQKELIDTSTNERKKTRDKKDW